ncbi:MAG TPA: serine hydrolase [Longimicrobiales bacterium]
MNAGMRPLGAIVLALALAGQAPPLRAQEPSGPLAGLDAYVRKAVADWGIAGAAVAVVKNDSVVFARGYGLREVGKPDSVDERTLFAIGSNSKLFTAVLAGMMVDEGKMKWSDPATKFLPGFQLYDPYVTREITLGDLLSHDSGLGRRGDLIWYGSAFSRDEILRRIRYLKPIASFRSEFGYQNIMVMAAGQAVAAAAGKSWDDLVRERIFGPLGMSCSNTSTKQLVHDGACGDVATPHDLDKGKLTAIPWRNIDNIAPAGSINSSVLDMAQWLRLLLAGGSYGGKTLIKPATLREIEQPHTITPLTPDTLAPSTHFSAYGYGVGMQDYLGVKVLTHTGGIDGMLSQVTWVPEAKLGVVILTNTSGHNALFAAVARRVLDAYLPGSSARDWSQILLARTSEQEKKAAEAEKKAEAERPQGTHPSLALDKYAGTYSSPIYGDVVVAMEQAKPVLRFGPSFTGDMEHWAYDSFRLTWRGIGSHAIASFALDPQGKVTTVRINGMSLANEPLEFTRMPEKAGAATAAGADRE